MCLKGILNVDCEKAGKLLSLGKIIAINVKITEPERFEEIVEYEGGFDENSKVLVSTIWLPTV